MFLLTVVLPFCIHATIATNTRFRVLFSCLINVLLAYFDGKFSLLFKCSLNFRAYAQQLELNKVRYTHIVLILVLIAEPMLNNSASIWKKDKKTFYLNFANSKFNVPSFCTFYKHKKKKLISYLESTHNLCVE